MIVAATLLGWRIFILFLGRTVHEPVHNAKFKHSPISPLSAGEIDDARGERMG